MSAEKQVEKGTKTNSAVLLGAIEKKESMLVPKPPEEPKRQSKKERSREEKAEKNALMSLLVDPMEVKKRLSTTKPFGVDVGGLSQEVMSCIVVDNMRGYYMTMVEKGGVKASTYSLFSETIEAYNGVYSSKGIWCKGSIAKAMYVMYKLHYLETRHYAKIPESLMSLICGCPLSYNDLNVDEIGFEGESEVDWTMETVIRRFGEEPVEVPITMDDPTNEPFRVSVVQEIMDLKLKLAKLEFQNGVTIATEKVGKHLNKVEDNLAYYWDYDPDAKPEAPTEQPKPSAPPQEPAAHKEDQKAKAGKKKANKKSKAEWTKEEASYAEKIFSHNYNVYGGKAEYESSFKPNYGSSEEAKDKASKEHQWTEEELKMVALMDPSHQQGSGDQFVMSFPSSMTSEQVISSIEETAMPVIALEKSHGGIKALMEAPEDETVVQDGESPYWSMKSVYPKLVPDTVEGKDPSTLTSFTEEQLDLMVEQGTMPSWMKAEVSALKSLGGGTIGDYELSDEEEGETLVLDKAALPSLPAKSSPGLSTQSSFIVFD